MFNSPPLVGSFSNQHVKRRSCSQCDGSMSLTRIEPGRPGYDIRTFVCGDCGHIESHVVQIDPMPSAAGGRASSHLSPPR